MIALAAGALAVAVALVLPGAGARRVGGWSPRPWSFRRPGRPGPPNRRGSTAARRRRSALRWLDAVISELRTGRAARAALLEVPDAPCPRAVAAAGLGGDVAAALRDDARAERLPVLAQAAACWAVAESSGAGLAAALDQVLGSARADEEVRAEVQSQLAAPRATARLLAVLPLLGLLLGMALGADPVGWLVRSPVGWASLGCGVSAAGLGVWWTTRLVRAVERDLDDDPRPP